MGKNSRHIVMIITMVLLISISCGGSPRQESPAPGCDTGGGCFPVKGGCFGKTVIQDLAVTGGGECLDVRVNNCNGGVLTIENGCEETLVLGEVEIPPGVSRTVDVRPTTGGQFELIRNPSNFSEFIPESNQLIEISGRLGDQMVSISFLKTAPLCD
jgi:hypothetical protein